jgi:hypothetical protein
MFYGDFMESPMTEQTNQAISEEFVFEDWLRDGIKGMRSQLEHCLKSEARPARFDVSEFRQHMRNARREQLLAVRSLIDSAIARLS